MGSARAGTAAPIGIQLDDAALLGQTYLTLAYSSHRYTVGGEAQTLSYNKTSLHWAKRANQPFLQFFCLINLIISLSNLYRLYKQGEIAEVWRYVEDSFHLIQTHNYLGLEGTALVIQGIAYQAQQEWSTALTVVTQGATLCQNQGNIVISEYAQETLIILNVQLGNFAQLRHLAMAAYKRARTYGNPFKMRLHLYQWGLAETSLGNWAASETCLKQALALAKMQNDLAYQMKVCFQLGYLSILQEQVTGAATYFQDALQLGKAVDAPDPWALARAGLALTHLRQGEPNQALVELKPLLATDKLPIVDGLNHAFIELVMVQVLAAQQDPRANEILDRIYREIQTLASKIKDDALRNAFLKDIRNHREIVALWQAKNM